MHLYEGHRKVTFISKFHKDLLVPKSGFQHATLGTFLPSDGGFGMDDNRHKSWNHMAVEAANPTGEQVDEA